MTAEFQFRVTGCFACIVFVQTYPLAVQSMMLHCAVSCLLPHSHIIYLFIITLLGYAIYGLLFVLFSYNLLYYVQAQCIATMSIINHSICALQFVVNLIRTDLFEGLFPLSSVFTTIAM